MWFNIAKLTMIGGKTMTSIERRIDFDDFIRVWDCECGEKKIIGRFCPKCGYRNRNIYRNINPGGVPNRFSDPNIFSEPDVIAEPRMWSCCGTSWYLWYKYCPFCGKELKDFYE